MSRTTSVQPTEQPTEQAIRDQLARLLASPLFKHSRHYPALLKYVVEQTIEGRTSHLKERALGIQVFKRDCDYDTNLDPVVRTSACEVRKRIALYYHDEAHAHELRIELPPGSYIPEFRQPEPAPLRQSTGPEKSKALPGETAPGARLLRRSLATAGIAGVVILIGAAAAALRSEPSAIDQFWASVWSSGESTLVCVSPPENQTAGPDGPSYLDVMRADTMAFADSIALARISSVFGRNGRKIDIRRGSNVTLEDFRRGPAILIGAYNNPWTMKLADQLRYTFEGGGANHEGVIRDRQNPSRVVWHHNAHLLYSQLNQDYAIVSRFVDAHTEKMVVVVAGMGRDGTSAGGEFVTQERYLRLLAEKAPKGWEHRNLQVVLATEIINGNVGPPRIVATYFW
jgi:hypothetical protein